MGAVLSLDISKKISGTLVPGHCSSFESTPVKENKDHSDIPGGYSLKDLAAGIRLPLDLGNAPFSIGRRDDNDLQMDDSSVSKRHASIEFTNDRLVLKDLGSKNHTFVNGESITETEIRPGDCLRFGKKMYLLEEGRTRFEPDTEFHRKISFLRKTLSRSSAIEGAEEENSNKDTISLIGGEEPPGSSIVDEISGIEEMHRQLRILLQVSNELASTMDINAILDHMVSGLRQVVPAEKVAILLNKGGIIEKRVESGAVDLEEELSSTIVARVAKERKSVLLGNACEEEDLASARSIMEGGIKSILCVPVRFKNELLGIIYLDNSSQSYVFDKGDSDLVEAVASQAGIAIKNALLLDQLNENHRKNLEIERLAAIGTFAAEISHQMKNSLVPLQKLDRLRDMIGENEEASFLIDSLTRSAQRFEEINNSIRRLACPDRIDPVRIDISLLIEQALFNSRAKMKESGVAVIKDYDINGEVFVDHVQMEQALSNIFINAAEAMSTEGGLVRINVIRAGSNWEIHIGDNGKGIPEDKLGKIFDLFYTTKEHKGGNGLGLSLVRAVILAHGGSIDVTSKEREGTEFIITLPDCPGAADQRA